MGDATCKIEDCGNGVHSREMCKRHYEWHRSRGLIEVRPRFATPEERFWSKVDADGDCWEWRAGVNHDGYGIFKTAQGETKSKFAHRYAWQTLIGEIPGELEIDHRCRNRRCVNPGHLELVTHVVNVQRSGTPKRLRCSLGHRIMAVRWENGKIVCRRCRAAEKRAWRAEQLPPAPKTHCLRGHEYTEANTKIQIGPTGRQKRACRKCIVTLQRNYESRKRLREAA